MIRSAFLFALLAQTVAFAEDAPAAAPAADPELLKQAEDKSIEKYRSPFEALSESTIGLASRSVLFDWRKSTVLLGGTAAQLLELNNFYSTRVGGFVRVPFGNLTAELAVTWVFTQGSDSSQKLSLTPYRQAGRPPRLEIDINFAYALIEGVGTPRLGLLPTAELVFSVNAGIRYLYYPNALGSSTALEVTGAIFAPKITQREINYLERVRLPGMQVDGQRYGVMAGFSMQLYFRTGIFFEPRVMVAIPVFAAATSSSLGWWWELSASLGIAL